MENLHLLKISILGTLRPTINTMEFLSLNIWWTIRKIYANFNIIISNIIKKRQIEMCDHFVDRIPFFDLVKSGIELYTMWIADRNHVYEHSQLILQKENDIFKCSWVYKCILISYNFWRKTFREKKMLLHLVSIYYGTAVRKF